MSCAAFVATSSTAGAQHRLHNGQAGDEAGDHPWMNKALSPDERAAMVLKEMTLDEKIELIHGNGMPGWGPPRPNAALGNGGAGFVVGGGGSEVGGGRVELAAGRETPHSTRLLQGRGALPARSAGNTPDDPHRSGDWGVTGEERG